MSQLYDDVLPVFLKAADVDNVTVQTAANGTDWVTPSSAPCDALDVPNETGTAIEYRRNGAGDAIIIGNGVARMIVGITDQNQISFRRVDQSTTQVTVRFERITV